MLKTAMACVLAALFLFAPVVLSQDDASSHGKKSIVKEKVKEDDLETGKEEAKMHFEKGVILVGQENWEAALIEFEESLERYPTQGAALNRAMCLKALHRYEDALEAFEGYLEQYAKVLDEERRGEAQKNIEEINALIGTIEVHVNIDGAAVFVDGEEKGTSPLKGKLGVGPGFHNVRVEAKGYIPDDRDVKIVSGKTRELDVYLLKAPNVGFVTIESNMEGSLVRIDGEEAGTTPFYGELGVGGHSIVVTRDDYRDFEAFVDMQLNQKRVISATLEPEKKLKKHWFWSTTGLAIACTAATIAMGASAYALDQDYDPYESSREDYELGKDLMIATDVTLGLAAGSAVAALVLYFFTDWKGKTADSEKKARASQGLEQSDCSDLCF
ncbi:MAG: PEGA domain-containing protein [Pseudomonadota bacterium]